VEGFYEDSLTEELRQQHPFRPASVVLLDCDYYSSTVTALAWLEPYLVEGTVLLFDDWFSYGESDELGQQKAFAEYLEHNPGFEAKDLWEFENHGKGFELVRAKL
jgi:predicted O-methyltransferase YrrM